MGKTANVMKLDLIPCPLCGGQSMSNYKHNPNLHKCLKCHRMFGRKDKAQ